MLSGYSVRAPQVLPRFGYTLGVPQTSHHFDRFHLRLKVLQAGNIHKANPVPDRFRAGTDVHTAVGTAAADTEAAGIEEIDLHRRGSRRYSWNTLTETRSVLHLPLHHSPPVPFSLPVQSCPQ